MKNVYKFLLASIFVTEILKCFRFCSIFHCYFFSNFVTIVQDEVASVFHVSCKGSYNMAGFDDIDSTLRRKSSLSKIVGKLKRPWGRGSVSDVYGRHVFLIKDDFIASKFHYINSVFLFISST